MLNLPSLEEVKKQYAYDKTILHLPLSPTQEMIGSGESLYDYRKPYKFYKLMPPQEELAHMLNDNYVTLRELIYEKIPGGHMYFYLEAYKEVSAAAIHWLSSGSELKPAGEKRFKAILDSRVTLDDRGLLVIHYGYPQTAQEFMWCMCGTPGTKKYRVWG